MPKSMAMRALRLVELAAECCRRPTGGRHPDRHPRGRPAPIRLPARPGLAAQWLRPDQSAAVSPFGTIRCADRHRGGDAVRIAVLASIAHRTAAALVRALGAGRLDARRGSRRARPRRHPVRHRRLGHLGAAARRGRRPATRRTATSTPRSTRRCTSPRSFERADEFDVISNQFDFLPLDLQPARRDARGDDRSTASPPSGSCPSTAPTTTSRTTCRSATPTGTPTSPTPPPSTTASTSTQFTFAAGAGGYLLFLGRIHPDKGTHRGDRGRPARRAAARHRRRDPRPGVLRRRGRAVRRR